MLELDELWSCARKRDNKLWNWIILCRRTRQVVAYVCGERDSGACTDLRCRMPDRYAHLQTYSNYWSGYAEIFFPHTHQFFGRHTGLSNHVKRLNATARYRLDAPVRPSFFKNQ